MITGNGFTDDTTVTVDGATCEVTLVTLSQIKCNTPAHAAETGVAISVMSNGVSYPPQTFDYTAASTPQINSITFSTPQQGETMYVNGVGFSSVMSENTVTVDSAECVVTAADTTTIICTAPSLPLGTHNVVVHVTGKGLSNNDKTVTYSLSISAISSATGKIFNVTFQKQLHLG